MKKILLLIITLVSLLTNAQSKISIHSYIKMPKDTTGSKQLITDLNNFLTATQKDNSLNNYILPKEKTETFMLADEFKNIENSRSLKIKYFFKPYLTNIVKIESKKYLLQISHIGVKDSLPYLRTVYNLIAHKTNNNTFLFSSPLVRNTKKWKSKTISHFTFYYKKTLNKKNAKNFVNLATQFDKKLNSKNSTTKIYCTNNRYELLKLFGVDYRSDYNGRNSGVFSTSNKNEQLIILGNNNSNFNNFDAHDLWHDRLNLVKSRRLLNKPVDEGCAYLYGGSWDLSWQTIFNQFVKKVASDKNINWAYYKENPKNFADTKAEHLMVDYVINALIIKKIEKEKGFADVWQLLDCGRYKKGNLNYYKALEKITGITKENYNTEVWKLINDEIK